MHYFGVSVGGATGVPRECESRLTVIDIRGVVLCVEKDDKKMSMPRLAWRNKHFFILNSSLSHFRLVWANLLAQRLQHLGEL